MSSPSPPPPPPSSLAQPTSMAIIPCTLALPSSRRLPPPCWTPDETSALISGYREKWYSLRRSNLRAAHWQEVADEVHRRCPSVTPPKTAVQCRHKMEKLRKRYRSDLQRARSFPNHRFTSSWQYFSMMDQMEKGPTTAVALPVAVDEDEADDDVGGDDEEDYEHDPRSEFGLRIKIQPNSGYRSSNVNFQPNPNPSYGNSGLRSVKNFDENPNPGYGNSGLRSVKNFDEHPNPSYGNSGYQFKKNFDENPNPNPSYGNSGFRSKKNFTDFEENPNPGCGYNYKPKYSSVNSFISSPQSDDQGVRYSSRAMNNGIHGSSAGPSGLNENVNPVTTTRNKEKQKKSGSRKRERVGEEDEVAMEMVDAIKTLGEGFVRMEKMKIEAIRETERMKMEMEMKRTQMILESQHRIVEAFAKGWADSIKVKKDAS